MKYTLLFRRGEGHAVKILFITHLYFFIFTTHFCPYNLGTSNNNKDHLNMHLGNLKIFLTGLLLTHSLAAFSHQILYCPELMERFELVFSDTYAEELGIDNLDAANMMYPLVQVECSHIAAVASVLSSIDQMIGTSLAKRATPMTLVLNQYDVNAFNAANRMNLPLHLVLDPTHTNTTEQTIPVWAHEYGHVIFATNLKKVWPAWGVLEGQLEQLSTVELSQAILNDQIKHICDELKNCHDPDARKEIDANMNHLADMRERLRADKEEVQKLIDPSMKAYNRLISPYSELFADTVAVLLTGRPDAIYSALFSNSLAGIDLAAVSARDFANSANSMENWNPSGLEGDAHTLLTPVRYHLWHNYLQYRLADGAKGKFLAKLFSAIQRELSEANLSSAGALLNDPKALSARLIALIDQAMLQSL